MDTDVDEEEPVAAPADAPPIEPIRDETRLLLSASQPRDASLPGVLVVGHGSRRAAAADDLACLLDGLRAHVGGSVAGGWIELGQPRAADAAEGLVSRGASRIVVVPLLFFRAFHATKDLPRIVGDIGARHPDVEIVLARELGRGQELVDLAARRIADAAGPLGPDDGLVVVPSGTSDAAARREGQAAAAAVAAVVGSTRWTVAYASSAEPRVADAVRLLVDEGARRIVVFSWSLFAGRLVSSVETASRRAAESADVELIWAGRFGSDPAVVRLVADRVMRG